MIHTINNQMYYVSEYFPFKKVDVHEIRNFSFYVEEDAANFSELPVIEEGNRRKFWLPSEEQYIYLDDFDKISMEMFIEMSKTMVCGYNSDFIINEIFRQMLYTERESNLVIYVTNGILNPKTKSNDFIRCKINKFDKYNVSLTEIKNQEKHSIPIGEMSIYFVIGAVRFVERV